METLSLTEFFARTADHEPVPGGGSVSAMAAAAAAALSEMVAGLTIGRKGHEEDESSMRDIVDRAAALREKLTRAVSQDAEAYERVLAAYRMPRAKGDEIGARSEAIEEALKNAALVPMEVAVDGLAVLEMTETLVRRGNPNAVTDGAVAAMMARSAVLGALYNVRINLKDIKDRVFAADLARRTADLRNRAMEVEGTVLAAVDLFPGLTCVSITNDPA